MLITFSGIDGAGKTTLAKWTAGRLTRAGRSVWRVARADIAVTEWVGGYIVRGESHDAQTQTPPPALAHRVGFILDELAVVGLARAPATMARRSLIMDRCGYDALVHMAYRGSVSDVVLERWARRVPRPDMAVYVSLSPQLAAERSSGAHPREYFESKAALYEKVFARVPYVRVESRTLTGATAALEAALVKAGLLSGA